MIHREDSFDKEAVTPKGPSFFFVDETATTAHFRAPEKPILELDSNTKTSEAMHMLADNNILSAPVWDAKEKKYLGFVDVFDLMTMAVGVDIIAHLLPQGMLHKKSKHDELSLKTLYENPEGAADNTFCKWTPVMEGEKFKTVLSLLASETRRVPVISKTTGKVINIISQSAVVQVLYDRIKAQKAESLVQDTPATSGIGLKKVSCVTLNDTARTAFQTMVENRVSAVGIVDPESGELVTAISSKDIRLLPRIESAGLETGKNPFDMNVREFVAMIRRVTEKDGKSHAACVEVDEHTSLLTVLGKLAATKMHRVFVVNKARKPVGVISCSDVIFALQAIQPKTATA